MRHAARLLGALAALALLTGCGRPLTQREMAFAATLQGDDMALERVRLVRGAPLGKITFHRKPRPPVTCRERIAPPETDAVITARPAAVTLFNRIFLSKEWYIDDYTPGYPDRLYLVEAMLLAHELTHVWQWQNRARTGYSPLRAAAEHGAADDPYLFDLSAAPDLQSFGYEQQGAIVEEYVCCRSLAPQAARTRRLHDMLSAAFPVAPLPETGRESAVYLPWKDARIDGICD
ncbi:hypothetical protein [Antarcticimicrobium luteum]|uniref:DUF4157 domain-containing protein n=1 Tax=Antarcticimicrobium luteum TaxID=2547397 RepID=A0A4R5UQ51_9RHOB|nr:hypothetical protein [Antarcticimicrobium luteum]TDK41035.1 hypothetical protein E1832_20240 [Antarcticimicrobium luteum]